MSSNTQHKVWFVVPAAGAGQRMNADRPKQYLPFLEHTIIEQTLSVLLTVEYVEGVVVAINQEDSYWSSLPISQNPNIQVVHGGAERADSVLAALESLKSVVDDKDWVLVHDAARPCVRSVDIQEMIETLQKSNVGGILAVPASDTLKLSKDQQTITKSVDRSAIWQAQTPQMFRYGMLYQALKQCSEKGLVITDESSAIEQLGYQPELIQGREENIKITRADDLWLAEQIVKRRLECE